MMKMNNGDKQISDGNYDTITMIDHGDGDVHEIEVTAIQTTRAAGRRKQQEQ